MDRELFPHPVKEPPELQRSAEHNLPAHLTPFVGRAREKTSTGELLLRPGVRLLTLTGPPGVGKTRLAVEVAAALLPSFPDGVYFVDLTSITDPALVLPEISHALKLAQPGDCSTTEALKNYLRHRNLLLVLDNFEQVVAAAPLIADILQSTLALKVLVTSRRRLHLQGEHEFQVPPLAAPDPAGPTSPSGVLQYDAVRLFVQRAQAIKSDFEVTEDNAPAVAEICIKLDGLPLAIELAAARIKLLPAQSMLLRLQNRLQLLTGGNQDLPDRQRTLQSAIEWSHELLNTRERVLFRRLAVFSGGCTLDTAEAICNPSAETEPNSLDTVASLLDKSLLKQAEFEGEPRFYMLETIREYAAHQLEQSGEANSVRERHAQYFLSYLEEIMHTRISTRHALFQGRLEREHDNMRAALRWFISNGDMENAGRMAGALGPFWFVQGHLAEGRNYLAEILAVGQDLSPATRAGIVAQAGRIAWRQGDLPAARSFLEQALAVQRERGDRPAIAHLLGDLGAVNVSEGKYDEAVPLYEESLALDREANYRYGIARTLNHLGEIARAKSDYDRAETLYTESLVLSREAGSNWITGLILGNLGYVALHKGDYGRASALLVESLSVLRAYGNKLGVVTSLIGLAGVAAFTGRQSHAAQLLGAAEGLLETSGSTLDPNERAAHKTILSTTRAGLDEQDFASLWSAGRDMKQEDAIAYALEPPPSEHLARASQNLGGLTRREAEIASLIAQSKSNAEIAETLVLSKRTVETHITNMLAKLNFTSRGQIAAWAISRRLTPG